MSSDINKHKQWLRDMGGRTNLEALAAIEALEGEVAELTRGFDASQSDVRVLTEDRDGHLARCYRAEAEVARLREALKGIAYVPEDARFMPSCDYLRSIARKALEGK